MANTSKTLELERLKKLKDEGVLNLEEYEKLKNKIINDEPEEEPIITPARFEVDVPAKKGMNPVMTGIISAFALAILVIIALVLFMPSKKQSTEIASSDSSSPLTEQAAPDPKIAFIQNISGVWSDGNDLIYLVYQDGKFLFAVRNVLLDARLGNIDPVNETANILARDKRTGKDIIWTFKKAWNADKTAFLLTATGDEGKIGDLTFVRKISGDDINKISQMSPMLAEEVKEEPKQASLTSEEALSVAKEYAKDAMDAPRADSLKRYYSPVVKYYNRGDIPLEELVKDKGYYYGRWPQRTNTLISDVKITDGLNGQKVATYSYEFSVSNGKKEIIGTAVQYLTFDNVDGKIVVVGENGKTLKSRTITYMSDEEKAAQNQKEASGNAKDLLM